jgi:hypothetical protein
VMPHDLPGNRKCDYPEQSDDEMHAAN